MEEPSCQEPLKPKWEDILGNGKLMKLVLQAGTGNRPTMGNFIKVSYRVYPVDDLESDFSALETTEPPFQKREDSFYLGEGDANLHAMELGIALMNLGEKAVIKCSNPMLGYAGEPPEYRPGNIPPNSNLLIFVELLADAGPPLPWAERPQSDRMTYADDKVERGNAYCRAQLFAPAINAYSAALRILGFKPQADDDDDQEAEEFVEEFVQEIRVKAFSGLSAAHFNSSSFDNALKCCDDALKINGSLIKVTFRRGRCLAQLGRLQEAKEAMAQARSLALENPNGLSLDFTSFLDSELNRIRLLLQKDTKREAELYRKMIDVKPLPPSSFKKTAASWLTYKVGVVASILVLSVGMLMSIVLNHY